jgi:hypothetical protein
VAAPFPRALLSVLALLLLLAAWREPRRMYEPEAQGAGSFDPFPFYDSGTWQQIVELGPGA